MRSTLRPARTRSMCCAASTCATARPMPEWPPVIVIAVMAVPPGFWFLPLLMTGADAGPPSLRSERPACRADTACSTGRVAGSEDEDPMAPGRRGRGRLSAFTARADPRTRPRQDHRPGGVSAKDKLSAAGDYPERTERGSTGDMIDRPGFADFRRRRRELLRPADIGLLEGVRRHTPGLQRDEVAQLANISTDYYARLEQCRGANPSESFVASLARVHGDDSGPFGQTHGRSHRAVPDRGARLLWCTYTKSYGVRAPSQGRPSVQTTAHTR
ncbi:helix-turn-helix domain-containing protein [Streptomyces smyrnaeus]|uniref:helix-turn-helix domain-containing protein n=1 Tax=Streptomyces smyrnaeus TaxID=1387713 RepID=UPI0034067180